MYNRFRQVKNLCIACAALSQYNAVIAEFAKTNIMFACASICNVCVKIHLAE